MLAIGDFGCWQARIAALHSLTCVLFIWQVIFVFNYVEFPIFININMRIQVFANKFLASDVEFTCAENANLTLSDHNNSAFDTKCFSMAEYNVVGEGPRIVRECSKFDYSQAAYKVNLNSTK